MAAANIGMIQAMTSSKKKPIQTVLLEERHAKRIAKATAPDPLHFSKNASESCEGDHACDAIVYIMFPNILFLVLFFFFALQTGPSSHQHSP